MRGTHRAAAKGCLLETAQLLERRFTSSASYAGAAPDLGCHAELAGRYNFVTAVPALAPTVFTIQAVPQGNQLNSTRCPQTLLVDQTGTRTLAGAPTAAEIADCWNR